MTHITNWHPYDMSVMANRKKTICLLCHCVTWPHEKDPQWKQSKQENVVKMFTNCICISHNNCLSWNWQVSQDMIPSLQMHDKSQCKDNILLWKTPYFGSNTICLPGSCGHRPGNSSFLLAPYQHDLDPNDLEGWPRSSYHNNQSATQDSGQPLVHQK